MIKPEAYPALLREPQHHVVWTKGQDGAKKPLVQLADGVLTPNAWTKHPERFMQLPTALDYLRRGTATVQGTTREGRPFTKYEVPLAGAGIALRYELQKPGAILVAFDFDDKPRAGVLVQNGKIIHPVLERLVRDLDSYTEITPSDFGVRIWVVVDELPQGFSTVITEGTLGRLAHGNILHEVRDLHGQSRGRNAD
jgi:hypothetical protein